ncbi:TPA: hypothetical protein LA460_000307 [Clostridium botulinum]|nr:hypothetical protein [Clostridium botulinum]HBJ1652911.1 hypothetical protein [Clostridium botulinum]
MHKLKIQNLEFVGENYIIDDNLEKTNKRKQELLDSYDEFQIRKLNFLNERYDNYNTKCSYWNQYVNNLHYYEKNTNTDIMNLQFSEIANAINSCTFASSSSKGILKTFCRKYCNWCVDKGYIMVNPLTVIPETKEEKDLLKTRMYSKQKILQVVDLIIEKGNPNHAKPLLLARMGILGKQAEYMRNLKWGDINIENNTITISNENNTNSKTVKVDKWVIDKLISIQSLRKSDKAIECISINPHRYVLEARSGGQLNYNTLNGWIRAGCESAEITRISFAELMFTRQMEQLLRRRKNHRLTIDDMTEVANETELESITATRAVILKQRYEELTGDKVFRGLNNKLEGEKVIELRRIEIMSGDIEGEYKKIMENLGLKED